MLSTETIKEDDARQNAGAQRLLKAHMGKKKKQNEGNIRQDSCGSESGCRVDKV